MKLIDNPRRVLRHFSTIALGLLTAVSGTVVAAWPLVPDEWKAAVPKEALMYLAVGYLVISAWGGIGKFIKQKERP